MTSLKNRISNQESLLIPPSVCFETFTMWPLNKSKFWWGEFEYLQSIYSTLIAFCIVIVLILSIAYLPQHSTHSEGTKRNRIQSVDSDIEGSPRPFDPANPNTPKMQVGCSSYNQHRLRALTFQRLLTILHLLCLGIIDRIYYHYY